MEQVSTDYTWSEFLRGATDEYIRRPLWDFGPEQRAAVQRERRRRFGAPADEWEFDPDYH